MIMDNSETQLCIASTPNRTPIKSTASYFSTPIEYPSKEQEEMVRKQSSNKIKKQKIRSGLRVCERIYSKKIREAFQQVKDFKRKRKNAGSIMFSSRKSPSEKVNILQNFSQYIHKKSIVSHHNNKSVIVNKLILAIPPKNIPQSAVKEEELMFRAFTIANSQYKK